MLKKCWIYYLIVVCLCGGCGLLLTSCGDDEEQTGWTRPEALDSIDSYIKEGVLMKKYTEANGHYVFTFENQKTLEIPSNQILNVQSNEEQWMTVVTLANNQEYKIPTQGTSLSGFIKEIKVNPSGYCPLAASVRMELPSKGCFKVKVLSKEGAKTPDQAHQYAFVDNYTQDVVILGLYQDYKNQVELTYLDKEGNVRGTTSVEIQTAPLSIGRLPKHHLVVSKSDKMEPGMTLVGCPGESETDTSIPYMIDADGEVRWLLDWAKSDKLAHIGAQCGPSRMKNGHYLLGDNNNHQIVEIDILGNLINAWDLNPGNYAFHHEVNIQADGKVLVPVTKTNARLTNGNSRILDHIMEFDPSNGAFTQEWDLSTLLDTMRYGQDTPGAGPYGQTQSNWLHQNGVAGMNGNVLSTARWQGVFLFTRKGDLKWIISPHTNWRPEYQKYLLQPLDKSGNPITDTEVLEGKKAHPDFDWAWGPHCPVSLPNGNILVFDNGFCRHFTPRKDNDPESYSRAVEYKIDEQKMTVQQVWSYGQERGVTCYASATSGVQYLPQSGNILFCPSTGKNFSDGQLAGGRVIEVDPKSNEVIYELEIYPKTYIAFHRAKRITLYPENL